MRKIKL